MPAPSKLPDSSELSASSSEALSLSLSLSAAMRLLKRKPPFLAVAVPVLDRSSAPVSVLSAAGSVDGVTTSSALRMRWGPAAASETR